MTIKKLDKAKSTLALSCFDANILLATFWSPPLSPFFFLRFLCTSLPLSFFDFKTPQHHLQRQPECDSCGIPLIGARFPSQRLAPASSCSRRSVLLSLISLDSKRARRLLIHRYAFHRGVFRFEFAFLFWF